jgi:hypothetical protein
MKKSKPCKKGQKIAIMKVSDEIFFGMAAMVKVC